VRFFLSLLLLLCGIAQVQAGIPALTLGDARSPGDLSPYIDYLEDAERTLDIADVSLPAMADRFSPLPGKGLINFGYSTSVYWLRIRLAASHSEQRMLDIAYPPLDRVDLYHAGPSGLTQHLVSGDRLRFIERAYPHRNLVFPLDLPEGESTIYLRIQSEGSMTVPLSLMSPDEFARESVGAYVLLAMYYGTLLALGVYNLLLYLAIRDRAYLEYVLFALGMSFGMASTNGFTQQFLFPNHPELANAAFPMGFSIAGLFGAMFIRTFLDTLQTAPTLDKALLVLMGLFALAMLVHPLSYHTGSMMALSGGLLLSAVALLAGLVAWRRGHPGAPLFLFAWSLLLGGVAVMAMRAFGWIPTHFLTIYAMQIGSTLDMLLLSFALADRINSMRSEKELAQAELISAKQNMLDALRRSEYELEARVELRTRELEAANTRLRDNEHELSRLARQDALTGLGNRIALEEETHKAIDRASRLGTSVAVMLIDLDQFKPVNDNHGHGVGDEVLRMVARRLAKCTRRTDTLARLGGDEFVVVVEGHDAVADAIAVAEKMVAEMVRPFPLQGLVLSIGASIGIAVLGEEDSPDSLLRRADRAMYFSKREGGNRYAFDHG
jgi:diguanylate cyclase (GGDEF)-like protein